MGQAGWSKGGRICAPARRISVVSLVAYGPRSPSCGAFLPVSGVTAPETRQMVPNTKYITNSHESTPGNKQPNYKVDKGSEHLSREDIQRAQRHMKRCLASLAIREMQIKTTMRYHLTLVRLAIINKSINNKCWQGGGENRTLVHCWWECRLVQPLWETVWNFLKKLKMDLPFDPAIPLLGLYLRNPETPIQKNLYAPMFIAALFIIAKF